MLKIENSGTDDTGREREGSLARVILNDRDCQSFLSGEFAASMLSFF